MGSSSVMFPGPLEYQGAVIFGKPESSSLLRTIQTRSMGKGNEENNPLEPHANSPTLPGAASPLRCGRTPLKMLTPEPVSREPFEADKEDTEDCSKILHETEQEVPCRLSKGSHEGSENMYPRTTETRRPLPLRVQKQRRDVQQSPNRHKATMATRN